jgi:hypothetical protein
MVLKDAESAEDSLILTFFDLVNHLTKNGVGCRIQRQVGRGTAVSATVSGG